MATLYQALDSEHREIRLLRLNNLPSDSSAVPPDILDFELKIFPLDEQPDFVALSYCWGDEPATCTIHVNEMDFMVRPNLHSWLKIMFKERHDYWIFIDAICINQDDVQERSSQVACMGDVYRDAAAVVAWLGDHQDPAPSGDDPDWQHSFNRYAALVTCEAIKHGLRGFWPQLIEESNTIPTFDEGLSDSTALWRIETSFWTRAWIVQELLLARCLIIRQGDLDVDWRALLAMFEHVVPGTHSERFSEYSPFTSQLVRNNPLNSLLYLLHERQMHRNEARLQQLSFSDVVVPHFHQKCSIMHDKVYSLLGMTTALIRPDYGCGLQVVYIRALYEGLCGIQSRTRGDASAFWWFASTFTVALARSAQVDLYRPLDYWITAKVLDHFREGPRAMRAVVYYWPAARESTRKLLLHRPSRWLIWHIVDFRLRATRSAAKARCALSGLWELRTQKPGQESKKTFARLEHLVQAVIGEQAEERESKMGGTTMTLEEAVSCIAGLAGLRSDSRAISMAGEALSVIALEAQSVEFHGPSEPSEAASNPDLGLWKHKLCAAGEMILLELWKRGMSSRRNLEELRAWTSRRLSVEKEMGSQNAEVSGQAWCGIDAELAECMRIASGGERTEEGDAVIANDRVMDALGEMRGDQRRIPPPLRWQRWLVDFEVTRMPRVS